MDEKNLDMIEIGKRLDTARKHLGISKRELAKRAGVTPGLISHYVKGRREAPITQLNNIADKLGVPRAWLTHGEMITNLAHTPPNKHDKIIPFLKKEQVSEWLSSQILKEGYRYEYMSNNNKLSEKAFAYEITGSSMVNHLHPADGLNPGDLAYIEPNPDSPIMIGELVLAMFGENDFRFRQYQQDGEEVFLKALDPQIPISKLEGNIKIVGVVVETHNITKRRKIG